MDTILEKIEIIKQIMINNINWQEQCKYCSRGLNTTYCDKNQIFMQKLQSINDKNNYRGNLEFICEFFVLDKIKIEK